MAFSVLAIDQATTSGWAFSDGKQTVFGHLKMPKRRDGERLSWLLDELIALGHELKPDLIVYEEPFFPIGRPGKFSTQVISWLQKVEGVVLLSAAKLAIGVECYPSQTWRLSFLGYGRKPKGATEDHMKKATVARVRLLGFPAVTNDEADAIGILHHALYGEPAMLRRQGDLLQLAGKDL